MIGMLRYLRGSLVVVALLAGAMPARAQQTRTLPNSDTQIELSFAPLVRRAAPAVVNIYAQKVVQQRAANPFTDDPFFRRFFGDRLPGPARERVAKSLGSGVIVREDGLVVTNHHVVEGADQIRVVLQDKHEYDADVLRTDQRTDLAVLRIRGSGHKFPSLALRPSDELEVGDLVLAIGNPFGVGQTVTSGIVSALARTSVGISDFNFFIQTDAAINPGNSGGALLSMDGRLVGINSAIYSRDGGSLGIGFAIPSEMVRTVLNAADGDGGFVRPWLGAEGQAVTSEIAASLDLDRPVGVLINGVHPRGPAAKAGAKVGDVVLSLAGRPVDDTAALKYRVAIQQPNTQVPLEVWRRGKLLKLNFTVEAPIEDPPRQQTLLSGEIPLAGATAVSVSPAVADELGLPGDLEGVAIIALQPGSVAARLGFKPGDVVRTLSQEAVPTVNTLTRVLKKTRGVWNFSIWREGQTLTFTFRS
jgi:Do/DeqQ family serine protease